MVSVRGANVGSMPSGRRGDAPNVQRRRAPRPTAQQARGTRSATGPQAPPCMRATPKPRRSRQHGMCVGCGLVCRKGETTRTTASLQCTAAECNDRSENVREVADSSIVRASRGSGGRAELCGLRSNLKVSGGCPRTVSSARTSPALSLDAADHAALRNPARRRSECVPSCRACREKSSSYRNLNFCGNSSAQSNFYEISRNMAH